MTTKELARDIKAAVEWLITEDCGCSTIKLDDRLAVCVGWSCGYAPIDDSIIHSQSEPDCAVVAGLKVWTSDSLRTDYDFINCPYDKDGDVYDIATSISPNCKDAGYKWIAEYLLKSYDELSAYDISEDGLVTEPEQTMDNWSDFEDTFCMGDAYRDIYGEEYAAV